MVSTQHQVSTSDSNSPSESTAFLDSEKVIPGSLEIEEISSVDPERLVAKKLNSNAAYIDTSGSNSTTNDGSADDIITSESDSSEEREHWNSKWDYILSVAGSFIGLGNIWRFPYLCFKHGGGAFLVPYATFLFFAGIPIFYLEQSLGQMTQQGGITAWAVVPSLKGIGYASVVICFLLNTYFTVILTWSVYYFIMSFTSGVPKVNEIAKNELVNLPYSTCGNKWNTECCTSLNFGFKA